MANVRPWVRGRAAFVYRDNARSLVLALKHGDRLDLARPAAAWLHRAARPILVPGMVAVPVPLHWTRLFRRRFNQSALLARAFARLAGIECWPDLLARRRATGTQDGRDRDARFANVSGVFAVRPRQAAAIRDRDILLVDDVMTSGATLAAATEACHAAGARSVSVVALARVAKDA
jgi:predicted amidophosphoribosyltransferase